MRVIYYPSLKLDAKLHIFLHIRIFFRNFAVKFKPQFMIE
jgi:hypothetical protein